MRRIQYLLMVLAVAAVASCKVEDADSNRSEAYLQSYSKVLRYNAVELPVLRISRMLDTMNEPFFEEGRTFETNIMSEYYYGNTMTDMAFTYKSDTTWTFTLAAVKERAELENFRAAGTVSFSTVQKGVRKWKLEISGSTSEDTGYSSEFTAQTPIVFLIHGNDFEGRYECHRDGVFQTKYFLNGKLFSDISLEWRGEKDSDNYRYEEL